MSGSTTWSRGGAYFAGLTLLQQGTLCRTLKTWVVEKFGNAGEIGTIQARDVTVAEPVSMLEWRAFSQQFGWFIG